MGKFNYGTFDIETNNWKDHIVTGVFTGETFKHFTSFSDSMEFMFQSDNTCTTYYAHWGGIFDFLFAFDFLFSQNPDDNWKIGKMIIQGRKILKFDCYKGKRKIQFIDSSGLFPFGLKKLTHSFDVKHKKIDEDMENNNKKLTKKLLKYLEHDCRGLHEAIEKFSKTEYINQVGLKLTRSGTSFAVFKKCFNPNLVELPNQVATFARESYFGGRTEIFKPLYQNEKKNLNVYDYNSLYPTAMHDNDFPSEFLGWTDELALDCFSISHCEVTCPNDLAIPLLPTKTEKGKLIFPTGTFDGVYTNVELAKAVSLGYKVNKVYKTAVFGNGGKIFKEFINHFYTLRKNTKDPVKKIVYKDLMNHLYGRLAINDEREQVTFSPKSETAKIHSKFDYGDYEIRLYSETKKIFTYSNIVLATFVTSYARLKLYDGFEKVGFDNVWYCDTDSIHTTSKMPVGENLGQVKLEYTTKDACYIAPKTYSIKMNDKKDIRHLLKMKGFPQKSIGHITHEDFVNSLDGEIRIPSVKIKGGLAGFKTAMKKGEILHVLPDSEKKLKSLYDKRIIYKKGKNYLTKPIHLQKQMEMNI